MSDLPAEAGERKFSAHNVIAVYPTVEKAREAMTTLERKGIEAGNIELLGPGMDGAAEAQTNAEQREADMSMTGEIGKRSAVGVVVGAILGALIVGAAAAAADAMFDVGDSAAQVILGGAIGGALIGAFAGFFYGGATGLPVNDAFGETFEAVRGGKTCVAVHSEEPDQVQTAIEALRGSGHTRMAKFGPDGKTTEV